MIVSAPSPATGLSQIAHRYDVLLCDVWGVIHNGRENFPAACAALNRFRAEVGPVILISNSPRPNLSVAAQLDGLRVPRDAWSAIVTSGDATRALLSEREGPVWAIGTELEAMLYEGLGLDFAEPDSARFICVTGPYNDDVETPEDYRERFTAAAGRGLELVCANPDLVVQRGERLIYCAGALAQLYETLGGKVFMAGKPHSAIYDLALAQAETALGNPVDPSRVLCIGDGLPTDVRGANAHDLDVLFIASGIHGGETIGAAGLDTAAVAGLLQANGLSATWTMADLVW